MPDPLGGVARALPALARAEKISRRAAAYGFDWDDAAQVVGKVREETDEVAEALAAGDPEALSEEIGDLLFSVANLARHAGIDPETALRDGTAKFERRFAAMARHLAASGGALGRSDLAAMEAAWQAAKRDEAAGGP
ncbi:MazG nucleotide pyrophosphohydrolase domain-containing protein [Methylobacterium oryzae CBMB20]